MYTQPKQQLLDSTTNDSYGRSLLQPYHHHHPQRLPQPTRVLKNRYLDQTRHRLRRSNDEYGQFLSDHQPEVESTMGERNPPAGLSSSESNRHSLPLNRALTNRKGAESRAFWHEPWENRDDPSISPAPSERRPADRKHFDIETLHPVTPAPYRESRTPYREPATSYREPPVPYRGLQAPYSIQQALLPPIARSPLPVGRAGDGSGAADDLEKFIERYKLHVGIENMGRGTTVVRAPDIRYIDLRLHLKDNSSLTIKSVPFSFH